eukprot:13825420-Alexandrium_andersonii.AAC.1
MAPWPRSQRPRDRQAASNSTLEALARRALCAAVRSESDGGDEKRPARPKGAPEGSLVEHRLWNEFGPESPIVEAM